MRRTDTGVTIESARIDSPGARWALDEYYAELAQRFSDGFEPRRAAPPDPADFAPPAGRFLLVRAEGAVRGCGGVRMFDPETAEIRRMWVDPRVRGRGAGRRLLHALEDAARALEARAVRLDTAAQLDEARALYASQGYREIPAYNDNAYAAHWFEKRL